MKKDSAMSQGEGVFAKNKNTSDKDIEKLKFALLNFYRHRCLRQLYFFHFVGMPYEYFPI